VQFHLDDRTKCVGKGPWECFILVRVERAPGSDARGRAFVYGLHDIATNAIIARTTVDLDHAGDGEYHAYGITVPELRPATYFWVSPPASDKKVKAVFVDRIFIRKQRQPS
jgi:hypothetical protein